MRHNLALLQEAAHFSIRRGNRIPQLAERGGQRYQILPRRIMKVARDFSPLFVLQAQKLSRDPAQLVFRRLPLRNIVADGQQPAVPANLDHFRGVVHDDSLAALRLQNYFLGPHAAKRFDLLHHFVLVTLASPDS